MTNIELDNELSTAEMTIDVSAPVETLSTEEIEKLGTLLPWRFKDQDIGSMRLTDTIVVIDPSAMTLTLQIRVLPNRCFTHTKDRKIWTGPYVTLNAFDNSGIAVLLWTNIDRINLICNSHEPRYFQRASPIKTANIARLELKIGEHTYWNC